MKNFDSTADVIGAAVGVATFAFGMVLAMRLFPGYAITNGRIACVIAALLVGAVAVAVGARRCASMSGRPRAAATRRPMRCGAGRCMVSACEASAWIEVQLVVLANPALLAYVATCFMGVGAAGERPDVGDEEVRGRGDRDDA